MSWIVGASGPSDEVAKQIEEQFQGMTDYPCPEPEESIKQSARKLIAQALAGNNPSRGVTVVAYGSQGKWSGEACEDRITNSMRIEIS